MLYQLLTISVVFSAILFIHFAVSLLLGINGKFSWVKSSVVSFVFTLVFIAVLGF